MTLGLSTTPKRLPETCLHAANSESLPTEVLTVIVGNVVAVCLDDAIRSDEKDATLAEANSNVIVALLQSSYKLRSISLQVLAKAFGAKIETISGVERLSVKPWTRICAARKLTKYDGSSAGYMVILNTWHCKAGEGTPVFDAYVSCAVVERILGWIEPPEFRRPLPMQIATIVNPIPAPAPQFENLSTRGRYLDLWLELACTSWRACAGGVFGAHLRDRVGRLKVCVLIWGLYVKLPISTGQMLGYALRIQSAAHGMPPLSVTRLAQDYANAARFLEMLLLQTTEKEEALSSAQGALPPGVSLSAFVNTDQLVLYTGILRGVVALPSEEALQHSRKLARKLLEKFRDKLRGDYPLHHDEVVHALDTPHYGNFNVLAGLASKVVRQLSG